MTTSHASRADLPLVVDRSSGTPLAAQIVSQLRDAVTSGVLRAAERLPSTRDLAATLEVSRTVVTSAYAQLFAEGWLEGRHGSGTYVADVAPGVPVDLPPAAPSGLASFSTTDVVSHNEGLIELVTGVPWAEGIDPATWRRAWRSAGTMSPSSFSDLYGLPSLRAELAHYLRRSRGLAVTPDHVLVTRGVSNGLSAVAAALIRPGDRVGVEEPGYQGAVEVLRRTGAELVPCRVDADGVVVGELPADLRLLYTTPAHQYPLGGRLPVARRQALVAWARATGAVIVEDDYDGEFRYDVAPIPALYSMDPSVVVYLGTTSKMLTPVFGAGWAVASGALVDAFAERRRLVSERVPEPVQHALLSLLASGDLERHIRRMRLEYARRRAALMTLPGLRGDAAGLHVVLELDRPAAGFVADAASRGVGITAVDRFFSGEPTLNAVVLGYGATPLTQVRRAATALRPLLSP